MTFGNFMYFHFGLKKQMQIMKCNKKEEKNEIYVST